MASTDDCPFCKIVRGELPATKVRETDRLLAFRDLHPQAPTHVLVIPKDHHPDVASMAAADGALAGELVNEGTRSRSPTTSRTPATAWCSTPGGKAGRRCITCTATCSADAP